MPYLSEWSTQDQRRLIVFASLVLDTFQRYQQQSSAQPESGGVLLGLRRGRHLEVLLATEPTSSDRRSAFHFYREADGHAQAAKKAWLESEGRIDYLGEWHTHPQRIPVPSALDRNEWGKLVIQRPASSGLVAVVVGTDALHVELLNTQQQLRLAPFTSAEAAAK